MEYQIDSLDLKILKRLSEDSRAPYLELAREFKVSGGTVHQRVAKLKDQGVIKGSRVILDYDLLGYQVCSFVGIKVSHAGQFRQVKEILAKHPEIVEMHYTTGHFSLLIKVRVRNMNELHLFLSEKVQQVEAVQSTETYIVLGDSLQRDPGLGNHLLN